MGLRVLGLIALAGVLAGLAIAQDVEFVRPTTSVAEAPPVHVPERADADEETAVPSEMPDVVGSTVTEAILAIRELESDVDVLLFSERFHAYAPARLDPDLAEEIVSDSHPDAGELLEQGFAGLLVGETEFEFPDGEPAEPWWWPAHALQAADGADGACVQCHTEGSCVQCHVETASRYQVMPDGTYVLEQNEGTTATLQDIGALERAVRASLDRVVPSASVADMSGSLSGDVFLEVEVEDDPELVARVVAASVPVAFDAAPSMTVFVVRCVVRGDRLPFVAITVERDTAMSADWLEVTAQSLPGMVDGYRDLR